MGPSHADSSSRQATPSGGPTFLGDGARPSVPRASSCAGLRRLPGAFLARWGRGRFGRALAFARPSDRIGRAWLEWGQVLRAAALARKLPAVTLVRSPVGFGAPTCTAMLMVASDFLVSVRWRGPSMRNAGIVHGTGLPSPPWNC